MTELKHEMKESIKEFIKMMNEEHGYSLEQAKTILISTVMDSTYEQSMHDR